MSRESRSKIRLKTIPTAWMQATPTVAAIFAILLGAGATFAQENRSRAFGPGHCGPADQSYVQVASATGGQVLPLGPNEVATAAPLMSASSGAETLLWMTSTLTPNGHVIKVPVDGVTARVSFIASTEGSLADMVVMDPRGTQVGAGMPGVEALVFACVRAVTVDKPATGEWSVRVSGTGTYWLTAHVKSELALEDTAFVQVAGRPGHEGLFKIQGQPRAGRPATLRARITREQITDAKFDLVSMTGAALQSLALSPVSPAQSEDEYVGDIPRLPTVPFRVRVSGRDHTGAAYQRISRAAFQAATVEILTPSAFALMRGQQTPVKVRIRNDGAAVQLKVVAVANASVLRVEPATLQLAANESREVTILIDPPQSASSSEDVIITAESSGDPAASNSAIVRGEIDSGR